MLNIFDIEDEQWDSIVKDTDIFYQRDYLRAFMQPGNEDFMESFGGSPMLIYYSDAGGQIVYPVFMHRWKDARDIISPYGYSGPVVIGRPIFESYRQEIRAFCHANGIIAEFARMHPWLSENYYPENKERAGRVWFIDLKKPLDFIFSIMSKKCRYAIRKAEKNIEINIATNMNALMMVKEVYIETMLRNGADQKYLFPDKFFEELQYANPTCFIASEKGKHMASAIFLSYGKFCHYFLAGSMHNGRGTNAGNLIIWNAIKFFKEKGFETMNLGGGISGLDSFKKSFTCLSKDFYIIKKIHDEQEYVRQCNGERIPTGYFFPAYRRKQT